MTAIDLDELLDRLRVALPQLVINRGELEHAETRVRHPAITIDTEDRVRDSVYRMTIGLIDDHVNFFVHVHGESRDLTTRGTQHFSKKCADVDEVFAIVCSCWAGGLPS